MFGIAILAKITTFIFSKIMDNHSYKKMLRSIDFQDGNNLQFMDEVNRQQQDEMNRQFMEESMKSVTPVELGGYNDQGGMNNF
jgi:hypothetical protein